LSFVSALARADIPPTPYRHLGRDRMRSKDMKKTTRILSTILLTAAASASAFAGTSAKEGGDAKPAAMATSSSASFRLPTDAKVGGVELKKGSYHVEWSGEGPDVQVSVRQGK